jgi:biopolymer transport protein ExbB/TolQ
MGEGLFFMKCSNCGFDSQEGANRCRRCGEPLEAVNNNQAADAEGEEFTDFSQAEEPSDISPEPAPADVPPQPQAVPPQSDPAGMQQQFPEQFPPPLEDYPAYEAAPPELQKIPKEPDPDAEYVDSYVFPSTPLVNELLFGKSGSTDPSVFFTAIIGALLALFFYKVFPIPTSTGYFHDLFTKRGVWPYASVFFLWWALALEMNKFFRVIGQKKILKMNLFPAEFSRISTKNVCKFQRHLLQLVPDPLSKIVTNRMWVGLQQFRNLGHMEEVNDLVQYQADIDMSSMESSFSFLNLLIWAHPIVGFLGTVVGIGGAIGGFSSVIESAVEIDAIKGALQVVTGGLSTAFDTTLIGLVFAMILMFTSTPIKKMEEDFLSDVENFTIRQLLNRMRKTMGGDDEEEELDEGARIRKMIEQAFQQQMMGLQGAFQSWQGGFSSVIGQIGQETEALGQQFSAVTPIVTDFREVMNQFSGQMKDTARQQEGMLQEMGAHTQKIEPVIAGFQKAMEGMDAQRQMISDQLVSWAGNFDKLGEGISERFAQMGEKVSDGIQKSGSGFISEIEKHFKDQSASVTKMNEGVTKEISKMSTDLIGKFDTQISAMDAQSKNLDSLSSSVTGEFTKMSETILSKLEGQVTTFQNFSDQYSKYMTDLMGGVSKEVGGLTENILKQFQEQLSGWLGDFTKGQAENLSKIGETIGKDMGAVSEDMISKLDSQLSGWVQNLNKELVGSIGDVSASVAKEVTGMGENVLKNLEDSSKELVGEMGKMIGEQNSAVMEKFGSLSQILSAISGKQEGLVESINQSMQHISSNEELYRKTLDEFAQGISSQVSSQAEILQAFNNGIDKVTSGNMFKDTLDVIRTGIEDIKPGLQLLATNISKTTKQSN